MVVEGAARRHALTVDLPEEARWTASGPSCFRPQTDGNPTRAAADVSITPPSKLALVALFVGLPRTVSRYDPHPKSYADAAARLDWPRTTLMKRVVVLRTRFTDAECPTSWGRMPSRTLAEWALATGLISRADLVLPPAKAAATGLLAGCNAGCQVQLPGPVGPAPPPARGHPEPPP